MSIHNISIDSLVFSPTCLFYSKRYYWIKTTFSWDCWNFFSVAFQQIFLPIWDSLSILIVSCEIRSWVIHNFGYFDSINVFKQIFVVFERKIVKKFSTNRMILLLKFLVSEFFISSFDFWNTSVVDFIANKIHENIKHQMSFVCFSTKF